MNRKNSFFLALLCVHSVLWSLDLSTLRIHNNEQTLLAIINAITQEKKGAYIPFTPEQIKRAAAQQGALALEIKDALQLNDPSIFKALPFEFFNWAAHAITFMNNNHSVFYSPTAFHFTALHNPDLCIRALKLLKKRCAVYISSKNGPHDVKALVCNATTHSIQVDPHTMHTQLDSLEKEILTFLKKNEYLVIVTEGINPITSALHKRLLKSAHTFFMCDLDSLAEFLSGKQSHGWDHLKKNDTAQFVSALSASTHIVCTTALLNRSREDFKQRQQEYTDVFNQLKKYGYANPYIVEAIAQQSPTFLENFSNNVCYAQVNKIILKNKGVNEAKSLLKAFDHFKFNDNDMIIKLTGRYLFKSESFLTCVDNHPMVDAFVSIPDHRSVFTGCFAMRFKHFKQMLKSIDFEAMEKNMVCIEWLVFDYLKEHKENINIVCVNTVDMLANVNIGYPSPTTSLVQLF